MFDDLRQDGSNYYDDEDLQEYVKPARSTKYFLGMTPLQRFVIALMLLFITCLLSAFCLLVTEKITLPFL